MATIVKLSHSILSAWANRQYEQAIGMYLGQPLPATPQMELGKLLHEKWANYIIQTGKLPRELGLCKLTDPVPEQKFEKLLPLGDDLYILLRGVPDLLDGNVIHEFKASMRNPSDFVSSMQLPYYKLLLPHLTTGYYRCYNPYTKTHSTGLQFLGEAEAETALEHILTFGTEIIDYLKVNKLLINYNKGEYVAPQSQTTDIAK